MSVIGVSPSDFILAARAINNICNIYRNGPRRLRTVLDSLEELKSQAESLESILEVANVQNCPKYGGFEKLWRDLEDASLFLARFSGLSSPTNALRKVKDATILSLKETDLAEWKLNLAEHRSRMESYKTLLILNALYNNHRADTEARSQTEADDDDDRILRRAVRIMQQRRQSVTATPNNDAASTSPFTFRSTASTLVTGSPEFNKIYEEIVSRAEELQLHHRDKLPEQDPAAWAEILNKLAALLPDTVSSARTTGSLLLPHTASPELISHGRDSARNVGGTGSLSHIQIPSPKLHELEGAIPPSTPLGPPIIQHTFIADNISFLAAPIFDETGSRSTGGQNLVFTGKIHIHCDAIAKLSGQDWMEVQLQISQIENKTYIWVFSQSSTPQGLVQQPSPRSLTPADILNNPTRRPTQSDSHPPLVLKHMILSHMDSYPVIHHPAVEKGLYDIQFNKPQLVHVEGTSGTSHQLSQCTYRFSYKPDRDILRSKIFGKNLLASAGYDNIRPPGACDFQTLTLWEDTYLGRTTTYMTLPCNSAGTQSNPNQTLLFVVTGCKNLDSAKKKNERLILEIETVVDDPTPPSISTVSSSTDSSTRSGRRKSLRAEDCKIKKSKSCEVLLYDRDVSGKEDKKRLISVLKDRFGAERK